MNSMDLTVDNNDNKPLSRDRRSWFQRQLAASFGDFYSTSQDENLIYEYMRTSQCVPETVDEICRQTRVKTEYVIEWLESMVTEGLVERQITSGVSRYVLTEVGKTAHYTHVDELQLNNNYRDGVEDGVCPTEESTVSARQLEHHLEEGCWVLVVGCSSGDFIAGLAKKFPHTSFIALHHNRVSLVDIMDTCLQAQVYNVNLQEGNPDLLPNSWIKCFDWVILYDVINDEPDMKQALKNARRILKNSGVLSLAFKSNKPETGDVNDNVLDGVQETETIDCENDKTASHHSKEGYTDTEFVGKTLAEAMFEIIGSDVMNSNEERIHIMCAVSKDVA